MTFVTETLTSPLIAIVPFSPFGSIIWELANIKVVLEEPYTAIVLPIAASLFTKLVLYIWSLPAPKVEIAPPLPLTSQALLLSAK